MPDDDTIAEWRSICCPICWELPEYCAGHKPDDPPHAETCPMCGTDDA